VLASPHAGDNTQLLALARALDTPFEVKRFGYRFWQTPARLILGATRAGLDMQASSPLDPPWPDLIIGAGRPTEAIAFWIQRHANPKVKIVYLGTPWAPLAKFDLVITTPQYRLPECPNVLHNALPLHDIGRWAEETATEVAAWQGRLAHLPRPWTAVLVGGRSGPYEFREPAAKRLAALASERAASEKGALLVTTSKRTRPETADVLAGTIDAPAFVHLWRPAQVENPYRAFLSLADAFIVTADSISMIAETCATGRPVALFDTEEGRRSMRAEEGRLTAVGGPPRPHWRGTSLATTGFRIGMAIGPAWWTRDIRIVHRRLLAEGRVSWLGDSPAPHQPPPQDRDVDRAVARVRALFGASDENTPLSPTS
jgi:mitochondrial fission protein ELM1